MDNSNRFGFEIKLVKVLGEIKMIDRHLEMMEELGECEYINRYSLESGVQKALAMKCLALVERDRIRNAMNYRER